MGSDSDLRVMQAAADMLGQLDVSFEMTIVSAHRTPERMVKYAESARERGLKAIIAGAGGAAHACVEIHLEIMKDCFLRPLRLMAFSYRQRSLWVPSALTFRLLSTSCKMFFPHG